MSSDDTEPVPVSGARVWWWVVFCNVRPCSIVVHSLLTLVEIREDDGSGGVVSSVS